MQLDSNIDGRGHVVGQEGISDFTLKEALSPRNPHLMENPRKPPTWSVFKKPRNFQQSLLKMFTGYKSVRMGNVGGRAP